MIATLSGLAIGSVTLTPAFNKDVTEYTAATTTATNTITATPYDEDSEVTIKVNGSTVASGGSATWRTGANEVVVTVVNGIYSAEYKVNVTKS